MICLVGGGQEINTGEAGISEWLDALRLHFPEWHAYISPDLIDSEYAAGEAIYRLAERANVVKDNSLHLAVSMRSFRAEHVSRFVKAVLDCETEEASNTLSEMSRRYPIAITRDLARAKRWIREHARGSERYGLVASSEAQRLKPHAIDVRYEIDPIHWFLNGPEDTRSSFYLEDAATQFQVQGLELDWVCMTWDADLRFSKTKWSYHSFRGSGWTNIHKADRRQFLLNAYRVLLTRARQGMVIFVPNGEPSDPTREAGFYDAHVRVFGGRRYRNTRFLARLGGAHAVENGSLGTRYHSFLDSPMKPIISLHVTHPAIPPGPIEGFSLLWAYYVRGFRPEKHCQECFVGELAENYYSRNHTSGVEIQASTRRRRFGSCMSVGW